MYVCRRAWCLPWIGDVVIRRSLLMLPLCMCVEGRVVCPGLWCSYPQIITHAPVVYVCRRAWCLPRIGGVVIRRSLLMLLLCMCVEGRGVCPGLVV